MDKILVIVKREYLQRVRTRWFLVGTLITPLVLAAFAVVPMLVVSVGGGERHLTILDQSGDPGLYQAIQDRLKEVNGDSRATRVIASHTLVPKDADIQAVINQNRPALLEKSDSALLVLSAGVLDGAPMQYWAKNVSDFTNEEIKKPLNAAITQRRFARAGFQDENISQYMKPVELKSFKAIGTGTTEDSGQGFLVAFVMLFFIYMTVLLYGISTMRGVVEEKQSRIVEVIVSSVKPFQMMLGKLVGIGLVGLTQYLIWAGAALALSLFGASVMSPKGFHMPELPAGVLVCFVTFFLLGYFLFGTLYAMVGSMVSSEEDSQQLTMPITMLIVVPSMIFFMVARDPNSTLSVVLSMVPFFSPTLMMLRIELAMPPLWQILASMALMGVTILGALWLAGRIYRVGILMYGKRPNLAELGRWIRYA
ncbi:MAG TPA: ABC transporter permease [Blastocatellia bacterium]|nr:ABC transporter permease [Blastocatellia bacterium]